MNNLKKILSEYEGEFNPKGWSQLKKQLPKRTFMQRFGKVVVGGAVGALVVAVLLVVALWDKDDQNFQENKLELAENNTITPEYAASPVYGRDDAQTEDNTENLQDAEQNLSDNYKSNASDIETIKPQQSEKTQDKNVVEEKAIENTESKVSDNQPKSSTPKVVTEPSFSFTCESHCTPAEANFVAVGVDADCEVVWDFGNGSQAHGNKVSYVYGSKGVYNPVVTLFRAGNIVKRTELGTISVGETPIADFSWRSNENVYTFYTGRTQNLSYNWEIDGKSFADKSVDYEFVRSGDYPIKLVLSDKSGCSAEMIKSLKVVIAHVYFVPNAFTPDSDGVNSTFGAIGENMDFEKFSLGITNSRGDVLFTSTDPYVHWNGKINNIGAEVDAGVYYWIIKTVDHYGNSQTRKGTVNVMR